MKHQTFSAFSKLLILTAVCALLSVTKASAQTTIGRQMVDQYPTTSWGSLTYGLTWLPTDYSTNTTQKYPLIIFLHGSGEGGDGVSGLYNLLKYALPQRISNGWNPEAVNPVDGKNYKFIVVSPQAPAAAQWSYGFAQLPYILNDVMTRYRVDPSRVYVTGLSAGGAGTWACVTNTADFAQKFAAILPVSAAGTNTAAEAANIPLVGGTYGVKVWSVDGANDAWLAFAQQATASVNNAIPAPSVPAILTAIPGVGHEPGAWNTPYDPSWRSNSQGINCYEWMLQYTRGGVSGGYTPPANQAPTANAGADQSITLPVNAVTLMGSGNDVDGSIASFSWTRIAGPNTPSFLSPTSATTTVSGLVQGSYTFRLTVTDNKGATATDDIVVTVNAAPITIATVALPGHIEAENYAAMSGIQTEAAGDAGGTQDVGWQDNGDWMDYSVNVLTAGTYNVSFRVATANNGVQFQLRNSSGTALATVSVPNTGWWQTYQNVTAQVTLPAGQQTLRVVTTNAGGSGWNFNYMDFSAATTTVVTPPPTSGAAIPGKVEAEAYSAMSGIQTESASDGDGTQDVGWQDNGDWMDYPVNVSAAGTYTASFRVATANTGVTFQLRNSAGATLATITVPNTGWWQTYQTVTAQVALPAGQQTLRIVTTNAAGSGWNFNWMSFAAAGTSTASSTTTRVQAEAYTAMNGIQTETANDGDGTQDVGWQDNGDWMDYSVNTAAAGTYTVNFRVATANNGVQFQLRNSAGTTLATVSVPNTGGWQTYQTVSAQVTLPAGQQTLRIVTTNAGGSGWNINWWEYSGPATTTAAVNMHIEAENYTNMSGIQTEAAGDAGGTQDVGWQDNGDWMDYSVNMAAAGTYTVNFRVATANTGVQFQLRNSAGTALTTVSVPNTGWWQTYQTVSAQVTLPAGQQTLRIVTTNAAGSGWNINWWEITNAATRAASVGTAEVVTTASVDVFPAQTSDRFQLSVDNNLSGTMNVEVIDAAGTVQKTFKLSKPAGATQTYLSISDLAKGKYTLRVTMGDWNQSVNIEKL